MLPAWLVASLLGLIEGLTEFLPVSSTGHLLIAEQWLPRQSDLFNILIQSGAVLAVIPLFWRRVVMLCQFQDPRSRDFLAKIIVAFGITGVGGLVIKHFKFKLPEEIAPVAWALIVGGVAFIVIERWVHGRSFASEITWKVAIAVALAQLVAAVFPGASRSGATILIALMLGTDRIMATEFSFLVGIPTLLAAGAMSAFKELKSVPVAGELPKVHEDWAMLGLATLVAAIVSFIAVKWLLRYVQSHTFTGFGIYRIVVGLGLLALPFLLK